MNSQRIRIRFAEIGDFEACLPLFDSLYQGDIGPNFKTTFEKFVSNENGIVLLAEHSNKVIGILIGSYHLDIDWEGNIAKIDALIVDKTFRRIGVGSELVRRFINKSRNDGCKALKSRINTKNMNAQSFLKSLGFERANTSEYFLEFQEQHKY